MRILRLFAVSVLAVALTPAASSAALARTRAGGLSEYHVFFGNLHSHTAYSDGSGTPRKAYRHARDKGHLDFLVVSEHHHADGIRPKGGGPAHEKNIAEMHELYDGSASSSLIQTAKALTEDGKFVALYGQEFSTISSGNHMNVFDAPHVIEVDSGEVKTLVEEWLPANKDSTGQTCVMQMNHPWAYPKGGKDPVNEYGGDDWGTHEADFIRAVDQHVQLIEVMNGPSHSKQDGERPSTVNDREYRQRLMQGFHLAPTADQDNHYYTWGTVSNARTGVIAKSLTRADLLDALRKRHVYATEDPNLRFIATVDDHLLGDIIPNAKKGALDVQFVLSDDDEPDAAYDIEVYVGQATNGLSRHIDTYTWKGNGAGTIEGLEHDRDDQYFYFKIVQYSELDGGESMVEDRLWTAPIFFQTGAQWPVEGESAATIEHYVASKNSKIYHVDGECRDARRIKAANRVTGAEAMKGRTRHIGCPK